MDNVVPIKSATPPDAPAKPPRKPRGFSSDIKGVLWSYEERVYEARAIARLVHEKLLQTSVRDLRVHDMETTIRSLSAIERILKPVQGLTDPEHLIQQTEAEQATQV